ncbi:hypothetical protein GQ457_02G000090 [Hibiscus cannabinus]
MDTRETKEICNQFDNRHLNLISLSHSHLIGPLHDVTTANILGLYTIIKEICDLLATCESPIFEIEQVATILNGIPCEFEPFVVVITASKEPYFNQIL